MLYSVVSFLSSYWTSRRSEEMVTLALGMHVVRQMRQDGEWVPTTAR